MRSGNTPSGKRVIDIGDGYSQTLQKRYYSGRGGILSFGLRSNAVFVLYNPAESGVNLFINRSGSTNLSETPVSFAQHTFAKTIGKLKNSENTANSNTTAGKNRKPQGQILYGQNVKIVGGVNPFVNSLTPYQTLVLVHAGSFLIAPGQSRIFEFRSLTNQPARALAQWSWWEEPIPSKK